MENLICKTCNQTMTFNYCSHCGEKIISDSDFSIKSITGQALGAITNFDSKVFKSLRFLFFYPGKLTSKFIEGIRVPYMKPFQIFVIANIVFFIFLSEIDLFRTPSKWFFIEDFDGIRVLEAVRQISADSGLSHEAIAYKYDVKSSNLAKGLIALLIPFIALVGYLLNIKRRMEFGKHIIFATHFFSFVLFLCVAVSQIVKLLFGDVNKWIFITPITFLMMLYYLLATKHFYKTSWLGAVLKGFLGVFLINICIQLYKVVINLMSLYSL